MQRPSDVSNGITTSADGLHVGAYGPFQLYAAYQPIYEVEGDQLTLGAYEALIRPVCDAGPVSPHELYNHVRDDDRLLVEWMSRALHLRNYLQAWPRGRDLFINVNPAIYESVEVIEREFEQMFASLPGYGLSAERLVCELVEEDALSLELLSRICRKFREQGARIALDDFGAGASGMERYRALRPEVVKVDGQMFRQLSGTAGGRRMLASIARTFVKEGTSILVEGIETQVHVDIAIDMGARYLQGYGLARPQLLPFSFSPTPALHPAVLSPKAHSA